VLRAARGGRRDRNAAVVVMGDRLGLYAARRRRGLTSSSSRAHHGERALRPQWSMLRPRRLCGVRPGWSVYTAAARAGRRAERRGEPRFLPGFFQLRSALSATRRGLPSRAQRRGVAGMTQPRRLRRLPSDSPSGHNASLIASWLPALDGGRRELESGARVATSGAGTGHRDPDGSGLPSSTFVAPTITKARSRTRAAPCAGGGRSGSRAIRDGLCGCESGRGL